MSRAYTREDLRAAVENAIDIAAIAPTPPRFYYDLCGLLLQINQKKDD